jgi:hypothetical protein
MKSFSAAAFSIVLALTGCASSSDSDGPDASSINIKEPEVRIAQLSTVAEVARHVTGGLPVQYRVEVQNAAEESITLKRVTLATIGEGAYNLPNTSRPFNIEVPANGTKAVDFWASANVVNDTVFGSNGPVSLRVSAFFDSPKGQFVKTMVEQVHYTPTYGGNQ